jgi:solute carrier family 25 uncoupling protein 8/9
VIESVSQIYDNKNASTYLSTKLLGGVISGAAAIAIANPTDVVKVRLQAQGKPSALKRYNGSFDCYKKIFLLEGMKGFYSGFLPSMLSSSILNTAELVTYFHSKEILLRHFRESAPLHLFCGFLSGLVCVAVGTPFVMIKTRMMNKQVVYSGVIDCVKKIVKYEGPKAFYKGWSAFLVGISAWNMVMFMTYEEVKKIVNYAHNISG